jgi:hypothetical protein
MGRTCSTYGGAYRIGAFRVFLGNLKKGDLQDRGVGGRIILKWVLRSGIGAWAELM